jgi:4-hydroxybenzoyl-CoA thioesterase
MDLSAPGVGGSMFKTNFTIEWGDCDEAGIVFYPNYFYWFDCAFQRFLREHGLSQRDLRKRFGASTPIVSAHADFKAPARYDDALDVGISARKIGESRFQIDYSMSSNGKLIGVGYEVRAWARVSAGGELRSTPLDDEFLSILGVVS